MFGAPDFKAMSEFHWRAAAFQLEPSDDTLQQMTQALQELQRVGNSLSMPYYHSVIAAACLRQGQAQQAGEALDASLAALRRHGDDSDAAEVYRVSALYQHALGNREEAAARVLRSIQVAQSSGARYWLLAAALTQHELELEDPEAAIQLLRDSRAVIKEGQELPLMAAVDKIINETQMA